LLIAAEWFAPSSFPLFFFSKQHINEGIKFYLIVQAQELKYRYSKKLER